MEIQTQGNAVSVATTKGIDVGKIEKELAAMWKPANEAEVAESGVTRACALNLLVYANVADERAKIDETLNTVCENHPGRTLLLIADREAEQANLDAYVSTRCRLLGGNRRQICGEQVTIEAAGAGLATAASAIEPLLVPDVSVFLWWKDIPHYEDKLFNRLIELSDRVVIDSTCFDHPYEDLSRLAQILRERPQLMSVSDLNWGRLTAWRTLIASFWDVPDYKPYLDKIDSIAIEYDPPDVDKNEIAPMALLTVGWLASRLGWKLEGLGEKESGTTFRLRANEERIINIEMRAIEREGYGDGWLTALTISAENSSAGFHVAFSEDRKNLVTEARIDNSRTVGRVLSYERKTEGQRLSRELSLAGRDLIYEEALAVAAAMIEATRG
jgi:glucose-6-phosphate dehydrogenase assembly protein OpcA